MKIKPFAYSAIFPEPLHLHLAFHRCVKKDVHFLRDIFEQLTRTNPKRVAEIQCGPAYYAECFADSCEVFAIDSSEKHLRFAKERVPHQNIRWFLRDPRNLHSIEKIDFALCLLDSIAYFTNHGEILDFFRSVYQLLRPGGILVIEANHPKDVGYIDYGEIFAPKDPGNYPCEVRVEWGVNHPSMDLVSGLVHTQIQVHVKNEKETNTTLIDSVEKQYYPNEIKLLAEQCGLSLLRCYSGYEDKPLDWEGELQVFFLQKQER